MILPIIDQNRKWNHQTLYSIKSWDLTQSLANNARLTPCLSFVQDCLQLASISIITLPHIKLSLISLYWWHHIKLSLVTHWRYPSIPFSCAKSLEMNSTIIIDSWRVFLGDFNNSPNANYQLVSMLARSFSEFGPMLAFRTAMGYQGCEYFFLKREVAIIYLLNDGVLCKSLWFCLWTVFILQWTNILTF